MDDAVRSRVVSRLCSWQHTLGRELDSMCPSAQCALQGGRCVSRELRAPPNEMRQQRAPCGPKEQQNERANGVRAAAGAQGGQRELALGVDDALLKSKTRRIPRADVAELAVQCLTLEAASNRHAGPPCCHHALPHTPACMKRKEV